MDFVESQVVQLLSEDVADKKSDLVSRSFSQWHDVACSDADTEEEYGSTEDYETDMQRHRALALEFEWQWTKIISYFASIFTPARVHLDVQPKETQF